MKHVSLPAHSARSLPNNRPLIGTSEALERLRADIGITAPTNMTVLIQGERGTGKELVAREIHMQSNRASGPFIRVNCASLPETLVETELFGCEKGAFTNAEFRKGRFEQADGGTLLLDEVGELSLIAQPKLLRVLETREVDRVGGQRPIPIDFRLIVSTNRDLAEMARAHQFREDLYDRLTMDIVRTPPLRERLDDIPILRRISDPAVCTRGQARCNGCFTTGSRSVPDLLVARQHQRIRECDPAGGLQGGRKPSSWKIYRRISRKKRWRRRPNWGIFTSSWTSTRARSFSPRLRSAAATGPAPQGDSG
ncbi:MAG TPA: sigma-54 factor interaction domain-containing protein [Terriglobia bacterium]